MEMLSPEKLAQIKAVLKEMDINPANQSLIQENKIIFPLKDKIYRVRMPNQREQTLAEQAQNKLKIKLSQEEGNVTRDTLIKNLKKNIGFDVVEKEKDKEVLSQQLQDVYLELAVVSSKELEKIEEIRKKKEIIESKFMDISIEIIEMLTPCIQEQAKAEYYRFLSYLCTEIQIGDDLFEGVWKDYEEYGKDNSGLTYKALEYLQSLLLSVKE